MCIFQQIPNALIIQFHTFSFPVQSEVPQADPLTGSLSPRLLKILQYFCNICFLKICRFSRWKLTIIPSLYVIWHQFPQSKQYALGVPAFDPFLAIRRQSSGFGLHVSLHSKLFPTYHFHLPYPLALAWKRDTSGGKLLLALHGRPTQPLTLVREDSISIIPIQSTLTDKVMTKRHMLY